jgi:hypothetical protein
MKITINKIDFTVEPVADGLRDAILGDEIIVQGVWRDVWAWDAAAQTGAPRTAMAEGKAVPLGNGIVFYIARATPDGRFARAEGPSTKMAEKMLKATGAKTIRDLMGALNRILNLPQKTVPFDSFAPLNPVASYLLKMHVDFSVVHLTNAGRALSAYLLMPGACTFHHQVTAITDRDGYDALSAANPALSSLQPTFIVPPRTRANLGLRSLSAAHALSQVQDRIKAAGGPEAASDTDRRRLARLAAEWQVLRRTEAALRATPPAPAVRRA